MNRPSFCHSRTYPFLPHILRTGGRPFNRLVTVLVFTLFLLSFSFAIMPSNVHTKLGFDQQRQMSPEQSEPIRVYSKSDLSSQGWPGSGTEEDPFVIESLCIETAEVPAFLVEGVLHAHLVIRDCLFESSGSGGYLGEIGSSSDIRFQNCTFVCGSSMALDVSDSKDITLVDCTVDGSGIEIRSSQQVNIVGTEISDVTKSSPEESYYSVLAIDSTSLVFENNTVSHSDKHGFFTVSSSNILMAHNYVRSISGWAFCLYESQDSIIRGNLAEDTVWVPIRVEGSYDCLIEENRVIRSDEWGIAVFQSSFVDINDNRCNHTRFNSIAVKESKHINVFENWCGRALGNGIIIERSEACIVNDNAVTSTDDNGLYVVDSTDCEVSNISVIGSHESCLFIRNSTEILVQGCYFAEGKICGIKVEMSQGCDIDNCWTVDCNTFGIELEDCQDMQVTNCTVARNDGYGITLQHTSTTRIRHNKVGLNRQSAFDSSGENDWDGNWWYEYTGPDGGMFWIDSYSSAVDVNAKQWNESIPQIDFGGPDYVDLHTVQSTNFLIDAPNAEWYWLIIDSELIDSGWNLDGTLIVALDRVPVGTHNITLVVINVFGHSASISVNVTVVDNPAMGIADLDTVVSVVLVANGIFQVALVSYIVRESRRLR